LSECHLENPGSIDLWGRFGDSASKPAAHTEDFSSGTEGHLYRDRLQDGGDWASTC
jgi:hypothetical protein